MTLRALPLLRSLLVVFGIAAISGPEGAQASPLTPTQTVTFKGNLSNAIKNQGFAFQAAATSFPVRDSAGKTHSVKLGFSTAGGAMFTPSVLTVDGFSGRMPGTCCFGFPPLNLPLGGTDLQQLRLDATDPAGSDHEFLTQLSPNIGGKWAAGTAWAPYISALDGNSGLPVSGHLSAAAFGSTSQLSFSKMEPDGISHRFAIKLQFEDSLEWSVIGASVDGRSLSGVQANGIVGLPFDPAVGLVTLTIAANTFQNASAENLKFDFSNVTFDFSNVGTGPGSSLRLPFLQPSQLIRFSSAGAMLTGKILSVAVTSAADLNPFGGPQMAAKPTWHPIWDLANVTNNPGPNNFALPLAEDTLAFFAVGSPLTFAGGSLTGGQFGVLLPAPNASGIILQTVTLDFRALTNTSKPSSVSAISR